MHEKAHCIKFAASPSAVILSLNFPKTLFSFLRRGNDCDDEVVARAREEFMSERKMRNGNANK